MKNRDQFALELQEPAGPPAPARVIEWSRFAVEVDGQRWISLRRLVHVGGLYSRTDAARRAALELEAAGEIRPRRWRDSAPAPGRPLEDLLLTVPDAVRVAAYARTPAGRDVLATLVERAGELAAAPAPRPADTRTAADRRAAARLRAGELLERTVRRLEAAGSVSESVALQHYTHAAEVALGRRLPELRGACVPPALPGAHAGPWLSPTAIGRLLGVTRQRVGLTITALDLRGGEHCRAGLAPTSGGTRTVYEYNAEAVRRIRAALEVAR